MTIIEISSRFVCVCVCELRSFPIYFYDFVKNHLLELCAVLYSCGGFWDVRPETNDKGPSSQYQRTTCDIGQPHTHTHIAHTFAHRCVTHDIIATIPKRETQQNDQRKQMSARSLVRALIANYLLLTELNSIDLFSVRCGCGSLSNSSDANSNAFYIIKYVTRVGGIVVGMH